MSFPCPCCRYLTIEESARYEVCPVCFWEDDGQGDEDVDEIRGGPNGHLSLSKARENFNRSGACEESFRANVRAPFQQELPS
ncbi:CPCC family cysteine-rich protein [Sphingopyxis panaciterrae]